MAALDDMEAELAEQEPDFIISSPAQILEITDMVVQDIVALDNWNRVFRHLVSDPVRQQKIRKALAEQEYHDAILDTLNYWISETGIEATFQFLLSTFKDKAKLGKLVGELRRKADDIRKLNPEETGYRNIGKDRQRQDTVEPETDDKNCIKATLPQLTQGFPETTVNNVHRTKGADNCPQSESHKSKLSKESRSTGESRSCQPNDEALAEDALLGHEQRVRSSPKKISMLTTVTTLPPGRAGRRCPKPTRCKIFVGVALISVVSLIIIVVVLSRIEHTPAPGPASITTTIPPTTSTSDSDNSQPVTPKTSTLQRELLTNKTVQIRGRFDKFTEWSPVDCSGAHTLQLEFVDLGDDPNAFVYSLQNCTSLRMIKMEEIMWVGEFSAKIHLPNLEEFHLTTAWGHHRKLFICSFQVRQYIYSVVFFFKYRRWTWRSLEDIHTLNTVVSVRAADHAGAVDWRWRFKFDPQKKSLEVKGIPSSFIKSISGKYQLTKLQFKNCALEAENFFPLSNLTSISVNPDHSDGPTSRQFGRALREMKQLEYIYYDIKDSTLDLADLLCPHLRYLGIFNSAVTATRNITDFKYLDQLHFHNAQIDSNVHSHVSKLFEHVTKFTVTESQNFFQTVDLPICSLFEQFAMQQSGTTIKYAVRNDKIVIQQCASNPQRQCPTEPCYPALTWNPVILPDGTTNGTCAKCISGCEHLNNSMILDIASSHNPASWMKFGVGGPEGVFLHGYFYVHVHIKHAESEFLEFSS